jgi:phage terminase large subunit GpA-like protein
MDALVQPGVEKIIIVAGAQTGKTAVMLNMILFIIDVDPGPILYVQPTKDTVKDFSTRRIAPMITQCRQVAGKVAEAKSRDSSNTLFMKTFPGGSLALTGANSPAELASRPIRWLFLDETDRFPDSAGTEGDPKALAEARTTTFYNKKIVECSTPTDENSPIEEEYSKGTQEEWQKECPGCGKYVHLVWEQMRYEYEEYKDRKGKSQYSVKWVLWQCPHCQGMFKESVMRRAPGKWVAHNPKAEGVRSFRFNSITSPWNKWKDIVAKYLDAGTDETKLKPFYNTVLGVAYDKHPESDGVPEMLVARREPYGDADIPKGAFVLTMGVDTQDNRLEYEIVGWGYNDESWGIQRGYIMGRTDLPEVWKGLDHLVDKEWSVEGTTVALKIAITFVDSGGHRTQDVYRECKKREGKRVFPIKGEDGQGKEYCYLSKTKTKQNLFIIGVDSGKEAIQYAAGVKEPGPRYCHWPDDPMRGYDKDYFKGLFSEKPVVHLKNGRSVMVWEKVTNDRNEPLDLRNYARAGFRRFNWPMKEIEARLYGIKTVTAMRAKKSGQVSRGVSL